jgi:hypothetical protein
MTMAGLPILAMTFAIVNVLPEPVTKDQWLEADRLQGRMVEITDMGYLEMKVTR